MTQKNIITTFTTALCVVLGFFLGLALLNFANIFPRSPLKSAVSNQNSTKPPQEQNSSSNEKLLEYEVKKGDTLFSLSLKFNVALETLMKLNNIANPDQIKAGQKLKIPAGEGSALDTDLSLDQEKMKEIQGYVDAGNQEWRLDPIEVVKVDAPANYGFTALDVYTLSKKDEQKGEAEVQVEKQVNNQKIIYKVKLIQPVKKGPQGIWAITSIKR